MSVFSGYDDGVEHRSPFRPGYGLIPPFFAGRDNLIRRIVGQLRAPVGHHEALYGPRGVGKTALLNGFQDWARAQEWLVVKHQVITHEATCDQIVEKLLDATNGGPSGWWRTVRDRLGDVTGFGVAGITVTRTASKAPRPADLEKALVAVGTVARDADRAVVVLVDEIQALDSGKQSLSFTRALQTTHGEQLPVHALIAGLRPPVLNEKEGGTFFGRIESATVDYLTYNTARQAIQQPLTDAGVDVEHDALHRLAETTGGYPYFTQVFGDRAWTAWADAGATGPLDIIHADAGIASALEQINRLYESQWQRMGPSARAFVEAMASLAPARHPVPIGAISARLGIEANNLSTVRQTLIERHGVIEPAGRGHLQFALPLFDEWVTARQSQHGLERPHGVAPPPFDPPGLGH